MPGDPPPTIHQLKIGLQGTSPPLWRRIQIPSAASLGFLHDVIQVAFGWHDYHLHCFHDGRGREWGERPGQNGSSMAAFADEEEAGLGRVLRAEGAALEYVYDFGDGWNHRIETEKIVPLDLGVTYPRCTGGRRAAPPAEDIGGVWGLEEVVYLVTHPEADPPEHFEDLVGDLRTRGFDPGTFDPAELTVRLSGLAVRAAARTTSTRSRTRPRIQRLTSADLEFCTCGRCRPGDPVRSIDGGYLTGEVLADAEVFPVIELPPRAELAAQARRLPLIDDAVRLAEWCAPGRQVTATGVLRPTAARQAVEELVLWRRDDSLADPRVRADALAGLRSAADIGVLDVPWRFASGNGLIAIRSGRAVRGPGLPDPEDADQLLSCWQEALEQELDAVDDMGGRILPGMLSMLDGPFGSLVFPALKLLYRLPGEQWLDVGTLVSAAGADGTEPGTSIAELFVIESAARLMNILSEFGAADSDWGTTQLRSDRDAVTMLFGDSTSARHEYRLRLTPLGRYGIRSILTSEGHTARIVGELADADAAALLDALPDYDPAGFHAEISGWLAGRDEATAVTQLLEAIPGTDPGLAGRRVAAISVLTEAKPDDARAVLREEAATGADGRRHVAAGALANLGEEPPLYRERTQRWLLIDLLTALSAGNMREKLTHDLMETIGSHADDLWRSDHPATAATLEATAGEIRDSDKALAKRLRRSAHKTRSRR